jgi:TorA maturation chaperone TorD
MDARNHIDLSARADFYLCLARAFMTPCGDALAHAMRDDLADELEELGAHLGLEIAAPLAAYRTAMQQIAQPLELLQVYSAIFLAPPTVACINAGHYLDGALNGGSVRAMENAYRQCGVVRDEGFHDLADHVSVQLEFAALLYAGQAAHLAGERTGEPMPVDPGGFLHAYAARWVDRLCLDLQVATAARELPANPYLPLAQVLKAGVAAHAVAPEVDALAARRQGAIENARAKYAGRAITAEDMAEIRQKLEARGLSTDHLSIPPELRGAPMGAVKKRLPQAR